jgi:hypothetical protein
MFGCMMSPAQRRWLRSCLIGSALVIVLALAAAATFRLWHLKGLPAYPVAVLPALPILWVLVEWGRFLAQEKDEFQRNVVIQSLLGGTGGILATTLIWGYLEDFAHAPHLNLIWIFPLFVLFMAIARLLVMLRYR